MQNQSVRRLPWCSLRYWCSKADNFMRAKSSIGPEERREIDRRIRQGGDVQCAGCIDRRRLCVASVCRASEHVQRAGHESQHPVLRGAWGGVERHLPLQIAPQWRVAHLDYEKRVVLGRMPVPVEIL